MSNPLVFLSEILLSSFMFPLTICRTDILSNYQASVNGCKPIFDGNVSGNLKEMVNIVNAFDVFLKDSSGYSEPVETPVKDFKGPPGISTNLARFVGPKNFSNSRYFKQRGTLFRFGDKPITKVEHILSAVDKDWKITVVNNSDKKKHFRHLGSGRQFASSLLQSKQPEERNLIDLEDAENNDNLWLPYSVAKTDKYGMPTPNTEGLQMWNYTTPPPSPYIIRLPPREQGDYIPEWSVTYMPEMKSINSQNVSVFKYWSKPVLPMVKVLQADDETMKIVAKNKP